MNPGRDRIHKGSITCLAIVILFSIAATVKADDGYRLWLRYEPLPGQMISLYRSHVTSIIVPGKSATFDAIRTELAGGCAGLLGRSVPVAKDVSQ